MFLHFRKTLVFIVFLSFSENILCIDLSWVLASIRLLAAIVPPLGLEKRVCKRRIVFRGLASERRESTRTSRSGYQNSRFSMVPAWTRNASRNHRKGCQHPFKIYGKSIEIHAYKSDAKWVQNHQKVSSKREARNMEKRRNTEAKKTLKKELKRNQTSCFRRCPVWDR